LGSNVTYTSAGMLDKKDLKFVEILYFDALFNFSSAPFDLPLRFSIADREF
jgi:hypothetical protein